MKFNSFDPTISHDKTVVTCVCLQPRVSYHTPACVCRQNLFITHQRFSGTVVYSGNVVLLICSDAAADTRMMIHVHSHNGSILLPTTFNAISFGLAAISRTLFARSARVQCACLHGIAYGVRLTIFSPFHFQ